MMQGSALANALKDFGTPEEAFADPFSFGIDAGETIFAPPPLDSGPDIETLIAQAVEEAENALRESLSAAHEESIQAQQALHAEHVESLNELLATGASALIAERLGEMEQRIIELTTSVTARILGVALTEDVATRAIDRLAHTIRETLLDNESIRIKVSGPQSLFEALKQALPTHADHLEFSEGNGFDLSVAIDDSVFETRLAEWSAALSEAMS